MNLSARVQKNYVFVLEHLDITIRDYLFQVGVLSSEDLSNIAAKKPNVTGQNRELLAILKRKGDNAYKTFFKGLSLGDANQKHLLKMLMATQETNGESRTHVATSQHDHAIQGFPFRASPFTYHEPTRLIPVTCPVLRMHPGLANKRYCTVTPRGRLENRPPPRWSWDGLMQYRGTISTCSLNHHRGVQYWETRSGVRMANGVLESGDSILEMGIAEEGFVDSNYNVSVDPRYWCVTVNCCSLHRPMICKSVWQQGRLVVCHTISKHHTPGTQRLLWFGIAIDVWRGRIVFIDVAKQVVLAVLDTQFRQPVFPMFGISVLQYYRAVTMELISGNDINMTDRKRWLISDAMSL